MSKAPRKTSPRTVIKPIEAARAEFDEVLVLIDAAKARALAAVNTTLLELHWTLGEYISRRVAADGWGQGTVKALAEHIARRRPNAIGFSDRTLWRMMPFYKIYRDQPELSPLVTQVSRTHDLIIMSGSKRAEEREFYLRMCIREQWGKRELQRQLAGALFERFVLSPAKRSPPVTASQVIELRPHSRSIRPRPPALGLPACGRYEIPPVSTGRSGGGPPRPVRAPSRPA